MRELYCYDHNYNPPKLIFSFDKKNDIKFYNKAYIETQLRYTGIRACMIGSPPDPIAKPFGRQLIKLPSSDASEDEKTFFREALIVWIRIHNGKYGILQEVEE